ncbi:MAG: long-chain fatty acid--CoA ligase [Bacteroidota bacterium]|nr:long-chain fatty acid--CoA ligase [Bacteroidota bacterium]
MELTRTFELLEHYKNFPREDALAGKRDNKWILYSTQQYIKYSHLLAYGLLAEGFVPGDIIATVSVNCPEWNFVDMALSMSGMVHLPIYPTISEEEYLYIFRHAEVKAVFISDRKLYKKIKPVIEELGIINLYSFTSVENVRSWDELVDTGSKNEHLLQNRLQSIKDGIHADDMVTMIYTSGTTGVPKGVMLSHRNLIENFIQHAYCHDLGPAHKVISFLPLCHIYERSMNYHFQVKGMGIYYIGNLGAIVQTLQEVKPDMFNTVPRLLERIYDGLISKGKQLPPLKRAIFFWAVRLGDRYEYGKRYDVFYNLRRKIADKLVYCKWRDALGGNVKIIVSGGAALQTRISKVLGVAGVLALEGYGLSETSPVIAVNNPAQRQVRYGTVGPILKGVEVKIAEDGEILCKGPCNMLGYYKQPELTKEVIDSDGWFHTGDVGCLEEGIYLKITDRKKEMFKLSGGKYIAPQMIENKFKESFFIEQAMVVGENEKFASALISPNFDYLHDWCSKRKVHFSNNVELIQIPEVLTVYQKEINEINKTLGQVEEIKRFRLVCEEWTPGTGELSPTLKLKRNYLKTKYQPIINDIYAPARSQNVEVNEKFVLGVDLKDFLKRLKI